MSIETMFYNRDRSEEILDRFPCLTKTGRKYHQSRAEETSQEIERHLSA